MQTKQIKCTSVRFIYAPVRAGNASVTSVTILLLLLFTDSKPCSKCSRSTERHKACRDKDYFVFI